MLKKPTFLKCINKLYLLAAMILLLAALVRKISENMAVLFADSNGAAESYIQPGLLLTNNDFYIKVAKIKTYKELQLDDKLRKNSLHV